MQDLSNLTLRMKATIKIMIAFPAVALCLAQQQQSPPAQAQLAHFHHVHINAIDPVASISFYTSHFNSERVKLGGTIDAVWAQKSWLLLNKVNRPAPSEGCFQHLPHWLGCGRHENGVSA